MRPSVLLALLSLLSCAHVAPAPQPPAAQPAAWYGDLRALAQKAAAVRGLTLRQAFEIVPLADDAFFNTYAQLQRDSSGELLKDLKATFEALTLGPGPVPNFEALMQSSADEVRSEQLIAFYHFGTHRLVVRRDLPPAIEQGGDEVKRTVLAHEVGHVLQDQLGVGRVSASSFDEALARRAVLEGDANLTAALVEGDRKGVPARRAVERTRLSLNALTVDQIIEFGGFSPKLLAAPPILRELFTFPYLRGQRFVTDLYAAGGLSLVDAMLKQPPTTTDAIFRPQRWLDGGGARASAVAVAPRRLGAVLLRALLEGCGHGTELVTPELLEWTERHFIDDSFQRNEEVLTWLTAWDDLEPAAPQSLAARARPQLSPANEHRVNMRIAERVMSTLAICLGAEPSGLSTEVVTSAIGLSVGAPPEATRVANLPRPAAQPPLGRHVVPTTRLELAFRSAGQGTVRDALWTHPRLGFTMAWPEGTRLIDNPAASLTATVRGATIFGSFVDEATNQRSADGFLNAALNAFFKAAQVGPKELSMATKHAWRELDLEGVKATETSPSYEPSISVRARVVPMCDGKAAFYVVAVSVSPDTVPVIERWMDSLRGPKSASICSEP